MTETKQQERRTAQAEPAGTCKTCQKPAYKTAEGKLRHDSRAAQSGGGDGGKGGKERKPDEKPNRAHTLNRKIGGGG